jgi:hypothetical protein
VKRYVAVALLLAGCANTWVRDAGSNPQDFTECRYEGDKAAAGVNDEILRGLRTKDVMESCLRVRGYRRG